jgi:hypothetical protein
MTEILLKVALNTINLNLTFKERPSKYKNSTKAIQQSFHMPVFPQFKLIPFVFCVSNYGITNLFFYLLHIENIKHEYP